jgi:hypothetical protein
MIMKASTQPCGRRPIWHWRAGGLGPPLRLEIKQWSSQTTLLLQFSIELQHALGQHLDPRHPWRASLAEDLIELGKRTVADSKRECIDATSAQLLHGSPRILGEMLLVGHVNTPGAQRQHPSKRWWRSKAIGGRSRTALRLPRQNGFAERLIGSIRRECLDYVIVLGDVHLRRILKSYAQYYNGTRTPLSLNKDAPISRSAEAAGRILCRPILGGLHHQYARI